MTNSQVLKFFIGLHISQDAEEVHTTMARAENNPPGEGPDDVTKD